MELEIEVALRTSNEYTQKLFYRAKLNLAVYAATGGKMRESMLDNKYPTTNRLNYC